MKTITYQGVEYPVDMIAVAKAHRGMAWGQIYPTPQNGGCRNCADMKALYLIIGKSKVQTTFQVRDGTAFFWIDEPNYSGWVRGEMRAFPCPVCSGSNVVDGLIRLSGLEGSDLNVRIEMFAALHGKEKARDLAIKILNMEQPEGFYLFYGANGRGKSMLLKAIANGYRLRNIPATYVNLPDLLADIRRNFSKDAAGDAEESLYEYRTRNVLCIDELDKANITDWAYETVFRIINHRHTSKRLTIFATEKEPDKGNYFGSRVSSGIVVEIGGDDIRQAEGLRKQKAFDKKGL